MIRPTRGCQEHATNQRQFAARKVGMTILFMGMVSAAAGQVTYVWNSGDLTSGAITPNAIPTHTVLVNDTLAIATAGDHDLQSLTLTNNGIVSWTLGSIRGGAGSSIVNATGATFNDLNASGYTVHNPGWGGSFTFTNHGSYVRNATGTTYFDIPFNNHGSVSLHQGDIQFRTGGAMAATGTMSAASGTNIWFTNGYSFASGSSLSGAGTFRLNNGTLNLDGTIALGNFLQTGGLLAGTAILSGAFEWNGGTWSGANLTIAATTGKLSLGAGADHDLNGGSILNNGTVDWISGYFRGGSGATFTNAAGATFNDQNASGYSVQNPGWGGTFTFTNNGSYVRNVGGATYFDVPFNNNGTVNLQQGALYLRAGGTLASTGTITAAAGTDVYITNSYTIATGSSLSGDGTFRLTNGTLGLAGNVTVGKFVQTGGALSGTATLNGLFDWNGGTWSGSNLTIAATTGKLSLGAGADHDLNGGSILNNGTVDWISGYLRGGSGATFTNAAGATFNDQNASGYSVQNPGWGGTFTFTNNGSYVRNVTNATYFDVPFNNNGTVSLQQGALYLRAGGTLASTGSIAAAAGTDVYFTNSYTIATGSSLSGDGTFRLTNGTLGLAGNVTVGKFVQTGGALSGTATLNGLFDWNGGTWSGSNLTIAATTGKLSLGAGADHDLNGGSILNNGTVDWISGYLRGGGGATFTNAAGATFNDLNASGYTVHNPGWGGTFVFTNNGSYVRSATNTTYFDVPFNNNGSVSLQQGALSIRAGGTLSGTGTITAAADTDVSFTNGYTIANAASLSGAGIFRLTGGTLNLNGTVGVGSFVQTGGALAGTATLSGSFAWNGGDWSGSNLTVAASTGSLSLGNAANHDLNGGTINNLGTVTWTSGYIRGGSGATFTNATGGVFNDLNASGYTVHNPGWGGTFTFTNNGSYVRNAGNTTFFDSPFHNNGSVSLQQGDLQIRAGGTMSATSTVNASAGTHLYFTNSYTLASGATFTGAGSYLQTGGTLTINGTLTASNFHWNGGDWNAATDGLTTTIASTTALTLGTGANHDFERRAIVNQGTVNWDTGYIRGGNGSTFTNASGATFNDRNTSSYTVYNGFGGTFNFINDGNYVRNVTGTSSFDSPFHNNGTVTLQQGAIQIRAGGTLAASGTMAAAGGTSITFTNGYTIATGSTLTGSGTFSQTGGTLIVNGTLTASNFHWNGGDWNAAAAGLTTTVAGTTTLSLGADANHDFDRRAIVNQGTVNWDSGYLRGSNGSTFTNAAGATFNDRNASNYTIYTSY